MWPAKLCIFFSKSAGKPAACLVLSLESKAIEAKRKKLRANRTNVRVFFFSI